MDMCPPPPPDRYGIIYAATHKDSGLMYVGQTVHSKEKRWKGHCKWGKRESYFDRAIRKHGPDRFVVQMVDWAMDRAELDQKERFWIDHFGTMDRRFGYNLTKGGAHGKHSEETKAKISKMHRGRKLQPHHPFVQKGRVPWNKGKGDDYTEELRTKFSEAQKKRFADPTFVHHFRGKTHTDEARAKMSAKLQGPRPNRRIQILCVETGRTFDGGIAAAAWLAETQGRSYNGSRSLLSTRLDTDKTVGGYHWRKAEGVS